MINAALNPPGSQKVQERVARLCVFTLGHYLMHAEKRGGAWMDEVAGQSRLFAGPGEQVRLPVAHMVCNQTPPIGDQPSLMTFR